MFSLIIVTSGVLQAFEAPYRIAEMEIDIKKGCSDEVKVATFHEMIYFTVVTLATVGYGDIQAYTEEGRVCVMILIIIVLVVIPK